MNSYGQTIKTKEQILLFKRLYMFCKSGTPLPQALDLLRQGSWSTKMNQVLGHIIKMVQAGKQLSDGLMDFKKTFQPLIISVIKMGESSGTLMNSFEYISYELQKQQLLKGKIITALLYPCIVLLATCATLATIFLYVFPKIIPIFESLKVPLPFMTRILLSSTKIVSTHYIITPVSILSFLGVMFVINRLQVLRNLKNKIALRIPVLGTLIKHYTLAHITRTLSHLTNNNVPIMQAVAITQESTDQLAYKQQLNQLRMDLKQGRSISYSFGQSPMLYPAIMVQLTATGERTGTLSESLMYIAQLYEQEIAEFVERITILIEPILMIIIGIVVGTIALSVITPLYGITQHLSS